MPNTDNFAMDTILGINLDTLNLESVDFLNDFSKFEEKMEVAIASRGGDAVPTTPQIR